MHILKYDPSFLYLFSSNISIQDDEYLIIIFSSFSFKSLDCLCSGIFFDSYNYNIQVRKMFKSVINYLRVIPVITTYYVIEKNLISASNADGVSMEPTIRSGDIVVIDRFWFRLTGLKKQDIVVAVQPVNPQVSICKRVV